MIYKTIAKIQPLQKSAMETCQLRLDNLTKPLGSLHGLELIAQKIAGITGEGRPRNLKKTIVLMAADHGVAVEGVSAYPQAATRQMVSNLAQGGAAVNILARHAGAELLVVDIGVAADLPPLAGLRREKVAYGTKNIAEGPAMTLQEAKQAVEIGIKVATEQIADGVQVFGLGDMGIGNTTPSTAIIAVYRGRTAGLAGRGTGISAQALERKTMIIEQAIAVNRPESGQPLEVLAKVGGLEIAGLAGVILGAAAGRAAVVVDGVIACAAALIAVKLAPQARDYLLGSHYSAEPAQAVALELIGLPAYLHMNMRLGEGTGAALGMTLIDAALAILNNMKTFGEAAVAVAEDGSGFGRQRADIR